MRPSKNDIQHYQCLMNRAIDESSAYPSQQYLGRGIVICGGGERYFPCVWVCVSMLRYLGCQLPIELWHLGPNEINEELRQLLAPLDVTTIDAYQIAQKVNVKRLGGWELKPFAIINSQFEEVLLIDADNVVVQNPEVLFESHIYQDMGSVFWPDRYPRVQPKRWLKPEVWSICEMPDLPGTELESGQMLVNKSSCWDALQLSMFFNSHSDFYYHFFYGDKDTYQVAWRKMGREFGLVPHSLVDLAHDWTMAHFDFDGQRLFQHRSGAKWRLNGPNVNVPDFYYEHQCFEFLNQLKERWSGIIRQLPQDFNDIERSAYEQVCQSARFHATIQLNPDDILTLTPDLKVCNKSGECIGCWEVTADKDNLPVLKLVLHVNCNCRCLLRQDADGRWHGYWDQFEDIEAHLWPVDQGSTRVGCRHNEHA